MLGTVVDIGGSMDISDRPETVTRRFIQVLGPQPTFCLVFETRARMSKGAANANRKFGPVERFQAREPSKAKIRVGEVHHKSAFGSLGSLCETLACPKSSVLQRLELDFGRR